MTQIKTTVLGAALISIVLVAASGAWAAPNDNAARRAQVVSHWTAERRAAAIPRDLVIDSRGLGYLRRADGSLVPHGHQVSAVDAQPTPRARPPGAGGGGGNNDSTPPVISSLDPNNVEIGASYTFSAQVSDSESGVKSVTFFINVPGGPVESFSASNSGGNTWSVALQGFTDDTGWSWYVEAQDNAKRGGNTAESDLAYFSVSTGGGTGSGDTVTNAPYIDGGVVQRAAGRIFFEMPSNPRHKRWVGYVCSGTVVNDEATTGRSVILTAAHCVYDDANGAFARNVMFIPDQDGTNGSGTDRNCSNDPIGCWVTSFGVVDVNWTQSVFPANIPWDYAYYVVADSGAHQGAPAPEALDAAVTPMIVNFSAPAVDDGDDGALSTDFTHGMGYSYSDDPNFMYCAEDMTREGSDNWWLPSCGLSGGSSGGPWVQKLIGGDGPVISVNSWGYTGSPGMAGPKLSGTSASCVFTLATSSDFPSNLSDGDDGYTFSGNCP